MEDLIASTFKLVLKVLFEPEVEFSSKHNDKPNGLDFMDLFFFPLVP